MTSIDPNVFRGRLTPEEAKARLAWAQTQPEYKAAYFDKRHPQHADYVEQTLMLHQVIAGEPAPEGSTPAPMPTSNARATIATIEKEPAYKDQFHVGHADAMARMSAAYAELHPGDGNVVIDVQAKS